jgi:hypothetical protein
MSELQPGDRLRPPALTVSSIFRNLEILAAEFAPCSAQLMLGARWSFGLPCSSTMEFEEFSFPLNPIPFHKALAERIGLRLHLADERESIAEELDSNRPVIVAVDSYFLPYRPAFGRVHSSRTIIVHPGPMQGVVEVDDRWVPCYRGLVREADLEMARSSTVPADQLLEPIFSGTALHGRWYAIKVEQHRPTDIQEWARSQLTLLCHEAAATATDEKASYGIETLDRFRQRLAASLDPALARETWAVQARKQHALILRAESSARVYLSSLLQALARWLDNAELEAEVVAYIQRLPHLQAARDVLTKTLAGSFHPEYRTYVLERFRVAHDAELRLFEAVERSVG